MKITGLLFNIIGTSTLQSDLAEIISRVKLLQENQQAYI